MRATDPAHKPAHFALNPRAKYQVIMIGHQLITEQLNLIDLQTFVQNSLKRGEVSIAPKNIRTQVTAIEGMIKPACFVRSRRSQHECRSLKGEIIADLLTESNQRRLTPLISPFDLSE